MSELLLPEVEKLALRYYEGLNCPRALTCAILLRYKEYGSLVQLKTSPDDFTDPDLFYRSYCATEFLRKYPGLPLGIDTASVAKTKWYEAEAQCYRSNERLSPFLWGVPTEERQLAEFLVECRQEVEYLIGRRPPSILDGVFGPGATVSDPARQCTIPDKLSSPVSLTPDAWVHVSSWSTTAWARALREDREHLGGVPFRLSRGNVWFSVPKDATTDRSCAKEPSLCAFYQRAYGLAMKNRLKRRGFDLEKLPEWHHTLARRGSRDGSFSTIDLSSASDTVCINLVKLMLPFEWLTALETVRSPMTLIDGHWHRLEKFSSMGNGYTFELETVLFLAICRVAARLGEHSDWRSISVFGDDILLPSGCEDDVLSALRWCGFSLNQRKTFTSGCFRESCGGDFFEGVAVRPHLLKEILDEPLAFIRLANGFRRVADNFSRLGVRRCPVHRTWLYCLDFLPVSLRQLRGPKALGDLVITDEEQRWTTRERCSIRYIRSVRPIANPTVRWDGFGSGAQMAAALYLSGSNSPLLDWRGRLVSRQDESGWKIGWTPYS